MLFKQKYQGAFALLHPFTLHFTLFTSRKQKQHLIISRYHVLPPCHKPPTGPTTRSKCEATTESRPFRAYPPDASQSYSNLTAAAICRVGLFAATLYLVRK